MHIQVDIKITIKIALQTEYKRVANEKDADVLCRSNQMTRILNALDWLESK